MTYSFHSEETNFLSSSSFLSHHQERTWRSQQENFYHRPSRAALGLLTACALRDAQPGRMQDPLICWSLRAKLVPYAYMHTHKHTHPPLCVWSSDKDHHTLMSRKQGKKNYNLFLLKSIYKRKCIQMTYSKGFNFIPSGQCA